MFQLLFVKSRLHSHIPFFSFVTFLLNITCIHSQQLQNGIHTFCRWRLFTLTSFSHCSTMTQALPVKAKPLLSLDAGKTAFHVCSYVALLVEGYLKWKVPTMFLSHHQSGAVKI